MKKVFKKTLSLLLSLMVVLSVCSVAAVATEPITKSYYVINGGTGDGRTADAPAATVNAAIGAANADGLIAGDTAVVYVMQKDWTNTSELTYWADSSVGKDITTHEFTVEIKPYDSTITTYLVYHNKANYNEYLVLGGPTVFDDITIVACRNNWDPIALLGNSATFCDGVKYGSIGTSFGTSVKTYDGLTTALGYYMVKTTVTEKLDLVFENAFASSDSDIKNSSIILGAQGPETATYNEDVNVTFNNAAIDAYLNWGNRNSNGTITFKKNVNIDIKNASCITNNQIEAAAVNVEGAIQFIVDKKATTLNGSPADFEGVTAAGGIFILLDKSSQDGLLTFTDTAGVYTVKEGFTAYAIAEDGTVYTSKNGLLTVPAGKYIVKDEEPSDDSNAFVTVEDYYVINGGTGDGRSPETPAATVYDAVLAGVEDGLIEGDIAKIHIMQKDWSTTGELTYWADSSVGSKMKNHDFTIEVKPYSTDAETYLLYHNGAGYNEELVLGGPTVFDDITIVCCRSNYNSISMLGNNATFRDGVKYGSIGNSFGTSVKSYSGLITALGYYQIKHTVTEEYNLVFENAFASSDSDIKNTSIVLGAKGPETATYNEDVNITFNNPEISAYVNWGNLNSNGSITFNKNVNFNIKAASKIAINQWEPTTVNVVGGVQFIIDKDTELVCDFSGYNYSTIDGGKFVLKNVSDVEEIITFTDVAGVYAVKEGYEVKATNANGDEFTSENGYLSVPAGEYNVVDYIPTHMKNRYYVINGGTGDGRTIQAPAPTVYAAIESINEDGLAAGDSASIYIMQREDWNGTADAVAFNMTSWATLANIVPPSHKAHITVQAYDLTTTTYLAPYEKLGDYEYFYISGPTTFKNITLVGVRSDFDGIALCGHDVTFGLGTKYGRIANYSSWDGTVASPFPGLSTSMSQGFVKDTYGAQTVVFENEYCGADANRGLYINGKGACKATYTDDVNIVFNNSGIECFVYWGNGASAGATYFEKNLNIMVRNAKSITNNVGKSTVDVAGALQIIVNSKAGWSGDVNTFSNVTKGGYWYILNTSGLGDMLSFTDTAGTYAVRTGYTAVATNTVTGETVTSADDFLTIAQGNWEISVIKEPEVRHYYVMNGGTGDGASRENPAASVTAVVDIIAASNLTSSDTAVINILERDNWSAVVGNTHKMAYFDDITVKVAPKLIVQGDPESETKVHLALNSDLSNKHTAINNSIIFKNLILVEAPTKPSFLYACGNSFTFEEDVEFARVTSSGTILKDYVLQIWAADYLDGNTYTEETVHEFKNAITLGCDFYIPGDNYNYSTHNEDVTLILDNDQIGYAAPFGIHFGPGGKGNSSWGSMTATFKKNLNINVKNASSVSFLTGTYPRHKLAVEGGIQLILNADTIYNTTDIIDISTIAAITTNEVYVLINATGNADILDFTETAGVYKVAEGREVCAVNEYGDEIYSENGELVLTPGKWTVKAYKLKNYYVMSGGSGDGRSADSPAATVASAIATINKDKLGADSIANIFIMQRGDWNAVSTGSVTHNIASWAANGAKASSHKAKIVIRSYNVETPAGLAYSDTLGEGDITLGGPTVFKDIKLVSTNSTLANIYADGNNLSFESSTAFYYISANWNGGELYNEWTPNVSLTKYTSSGSYNSSQTVIYKTDSGSGGVLSIPGCYNNSATHTEDINIVLDNSEIGRDNPFIIKFAGNYAAAMTTVFEKSININIKSASAVNFASGANANGSQKLKVNGGVQVITNEDTAFSSVLGDLDVFTADTENWFLTLDDYSNGNVDFTSTVGTFKVKKGINLMAVNDEGKVVTSTSAGWLVLESGNWKISKNTLPQSNKMLFFHVKEDAPFMQRIRVVPGATYNLTFSLANSVSGADIVAYTDENRDVINISPELLSKQDCGMYTTYNYRFTVPSSAEAGLAFIGFKFPKNVDGYIFDISLYKSDDESKTELFSNPDFKVGLNGWAYGWRAWFGVYGNADLYEWNSQYGSFRVDDYDLGLLENVLPEKMLYIKETKTEGNNLLVQKMNGLKANTKYTVTFDYKFNSGAFNKTLYFAVFAAAENASGEYIFKQLCASTNGDKLFDTVIDNGRSITYTFSLTEEEIGDYTEFFGGFYFLSDPDMITELYIRNLSIYESNDSEKQNLFFDDKFADTIENWYSLNGVSESGNYIFTRSDVEFTAQYLDSKFEYFEATNSEIRCGDANGDGVVDIRDLVRVKKLSAQADEYFPIADINKDSAIGAQDLLLLRKCLLGFETIEEWEYYVISLTAPNESYGGADAEADELREAINAAEDKVVATGTTYYISESGNRGYDGKSPENATTIDNIGKLSLASGDAVLFKRGDTFRTTSAINLVSGVSYGAYGSGEKPVISGSVKNYADQNLWSSNDGKIWELALGEEAAHIVFDGGKNIGVRKPSLEAIIADGDYYHDTENGRLYLFLTQCNPGSYFKSIEISTTQYLILSNGSAQDLIENVTIENISFKYAAMHAMSLICSKNFSITNCEFGWIGGAYSGTDGNRTGNAIQFTSIAEACVASNNYFYEVFDAAITFQGFSENQYTDLTFESNLIEYCSTGLEFWAATANQNTADPYAQIENIAFNNNILRFGGYGFGGTQRKVNADQGFIVKRDYAYGENQLVNINITNNIFDSSNGYFFNTANTNEELNISGNAYYQQKGSNYPVVKNSGLYSSDEQAFNEEIALIDESPETVVWLTEEVIKLKSIKKIARIGWRVYEGSSPPEQSLASFRAAYEQGYRILLCDVRFTADGHIVCLHDDTINSVARNKDGSALSKTVYINDITLAEANEYDFGIKKGTQYAGTTILRLEEFLALCEELDCTPHLEIKEDPNRQQSDYIVSLLKKHGFERNVMFNGGSVNVMKYFASKLPEAVMGKWVGAISDELIDEIASYGTTNKKFIYVSNGFDYSITEENYLKCLEKGLDIGYTEIRSLEELAAVKESGFLKYCEYFATRYFDLTE